MQHSAQEPKIRADRILMDADSFAADVAARYTDASKTWIATAAANHVAWMQGAGTHAICWADWATAACSRTTSTVSVT